MTDALTVLNELRESRGIPYAYNHFAEGESPDPPFVVYLYPESDHFLADSHVYRKITEVHIELYTDRKDPNLEKALEDILDEHELCYEKSEVWIAEERLYEVMYTMEVLQNG